MPLEYYHFQKLFPGMSLNSWQDVENRLKKNGGREGIRTPGLLIANSEGKTLGLGATITWLFSRGS